MGDVGRETDALERPSPWKADVAHGQGYSFRVNPYREMVSDMVRYTRLPFCGLRPFMRMVASIAQAAVEAGCPKKGVYLEDLSLCEFTFIEGGPHLGDCALWAASALRLVGVRVRAIAYEPLPDAAGLFQQSVLENGFGGAVEVKMAALGAQRGPVEMIHFRGHNGQATVNGQDFPSHDPREVVKVPTEELALDEEIPANWPRIDTLKLSANGAERNILAGAQRLLKNGRICSVLMHARKAKRGRRPILEDPAPGNVSRYAYELMMWLEEGNMDIYEHNDALTGKGRGRVQRLTTPKEMDEIFDDPELTEQIYFLAISRHRHCASAQRHFHSALDRPAGAPLEVPGFWD